MILFDDVTGHITDAGFAALESDQLELQQRLELAEHLSFCDDCCARYTAFLEHRPLLEPPHPVAAPVIRRIRSHGRLILLRRALRVGLAACLLITVLSVFAPPLTGVKSGSLRLDFELQQNTAAAQQLARQAAKDKEIEPQTLNMRISNAVDQLIAALKEKGETKQ